MKLKFSAAFSPSALIFIPLLIQYVLYLYIDLFTENIVLTKNSTIYSNVWNLSALLVTYLGIFFSKKLFNNKCSIAKINYKYSYLLFLYLISTLTALVGFLFFFRNGWGIFNLIADSSNPVDLAGATSSLRNEDLIPGITSLVWIAILSIPIYIILYNHYKVNRLCKLLLIINVLIVLFVSMLASVRIMLIFCILNSIIAFMYTSRYKNINISLINFVIIILSAISILVTVFILSENYRMFSHYYDQNFLKKIDYLIVPYIAKNQWNAFEFINFDDYGAILFSWPVLVKIFDYFIPLLPNIEAPYLAGQYGTVTLYGLWYYDFGPLFSLILFFLLGFLSQYYFIKSKNSSLYLLRFCIIAPGLLSFCRGNYFGSTPFFACISFLLFSNFLYFLLGGKYIYNKDFG